MTVEPRRRPRAFAEDWRAEGTPRPPTTLPNPLGAAGRSQPPSLRPASIGERFQRIDLETLAGAPQLDVPGGIDLSPDGREVAFAWDASGDLEVYTAPLVGDRIIQLTDAGRRSFAPRWSPDAGWLAFLRDHGDGWARIHLVDRDGEHERALTGDEDVAHGEIAWSPDGTRIAYVAARRGGQPVLHVMDVATGEHHRLGAGPDSVPRWAPDGRWLLFTTGAAGELALVRPEGGDPRRLDVGPAGGRDARWSPDGEAIAFSFRDGERSRVAVAHLLEAEVRRVEPFSATPFDDDAPAWRPDGRGLIYRHRRAGSQSLRRAFTISHADEAVLDDPGAYHAHAVGPDSETVVALLSRSREPADVVVRPRGATTAVRVTRSLPGSIDIGVFVEPAYLEQDGAGALVYVPHAEAAGGRPAPVVLSATGEAPVRSWDALVQALANQGFAVIVAATVATASAVATRLRDEGVAADAQAQQPELIPARMTRRDRIETFKKVLAWAAEELTRS